MKFTLILSILGALVNGLLWDGATTDTDALVFGAATIFYIGGAVFLIVVSIRDRIAERRIY